MVKRWSESRVSRLASFLSSSGSASLGERAEEEEGRAILTSEPVCGVVPLQPFVVAGKNVLKQKKKMEEVGVSVVIDNREEVG